MGRLLKKILFLGVLTLLPLSIYNYQNDYYGVFQRELMNRYNEPNVRFIKTQHLLEHPQMYKSLIFGSSRTGKILAHNHDPSVYNMYYSEGLPAEFLEDLETLFEAGVNIEKVYIGLDEFSFMINPEKHKDQLLRMKYETGLVNQASAYIQFLIDPPKIGVAKYEIPTDFDLTNSGNPLHFQVDTTIENDIPSHVEANKFHSPKKYYTLRIDKTCGEIQAIIKLCESYKTEVHFFFNPVFVNTYTQYDFEIISAIKSNLAHITPFVDFSGINKITVDPYNYYETNHYRYFIGDTIWLHLTEEQECSVAKYVQGSTVESLLAREKAKWP